MNFYSNPKTFSLSCINHECENKISDKTIEGIYIIISNIHESNFKIFTSIDSIKINNEEIKISHGENIISLEGMFHTLQNTFIAVRAETNITLYLNEFKIYKFEYFSQNFYLNFKMCNFIDENDNNKEFEYILISKINKDFSDYSIDVYEIGSMLPKSFHMKKILNGFNFGKVENKEAKIKYNEKVKLNPPVKINDTRDDIINKGINNILQEKKVFSYSYPFMFNDEETNLIVNEKNSEIDNKNNSDESILINNEKNDKNKEKNDKNKEKNDKNKEKNENKEKNDKFSFFWAKKEDEEKEKELVKKIYVNNSFDKFFLGKMILWDRNYLLFATPFNQIDIINYKKNLKIGFIKNSTKENNYKNFYQISNISNKILNRYYGESFVFSYVKKLFPEDKIKKNKTNEKNKNSKAKKNEKKENEIKIKENNDNNENNNNITNENNLTNENNIETIGNGNINSINKNPTIETKSTIKKPNNIKIKYIRKKDLKDFLNYKLLNNSNTYNNLIEKEKLEHLYFSIEFHYILLIISYLIPFIISLIQYIKILKKENSFEEEKIPNVVFIYYFFYIIFGIWFKIFVYNVDDESHTQRICTKITMIVFIILKIYIDCVFFKSIVKKNELHFLLLAAIFVFLLIQIITNFVIYKLKIYFLLESNWITYTYYQISKLVCLVYFTIMSFIKKKTPDDYSILFFDLLILIVIMVYIYLVLLYNAFQFNFPYTIIYQIIFNFYFEWINVILYVFDDPIVVIKYFDKKCCFCDGFFYKIFLYLIMLIVLFFVFIVCFILQIVEFIVNQFNKNDESKKRKNYFKWMSENFDICNK